MYISILLLLITIFTPSTLAHVPVDSGDNDHIEHALHIHDPAKSWAIYDEISEPGEVQYYSFDLKAGDRLKISIFTPEEEEFTPNLMIMTPGGYINEPAFAFVEIPDGYNFTIIEGKRPTSADYEPFTPSASYRILEFDEKVELSGKYYIAVYEPTNKGKFGIAIGYVESFSISEWLLIPYDVINIHLWEGQHIGFILAPIIIIFVLGIIFLFYRHFKLKKSPSNIIAWLGSVVALLYIGSGGIIFNQMIVAISKSSLNPAVLVTLIFMMIPIILGIAIFRIILKENSRIQLNDRVLFIIYGILGLFFWAGLIIGPVLIIFASVLPNDFKSIIKSKYN